MSSKPLSKETLKALEKVIPLLGSPVEGEVAAAAAAMTRIMTKNGNDWHDFNNHVQQQIGHKPTDQYGRQQTTTQTQRDFYKNDDRTLVDSGILRGVIDAIWAEGQGFMNVNVAEFLSSMLDRCDKYSVVRLSPKQGTWLRDLAHRAKVPFPIKLEV